jgi:2,7-dihydroxy-5-methyl-1-naphthoate 7-O-methyltransferase
VLNDWPDEETVAILRRCAEAAASAASAASAEDTASAASPGRVVVLGGVAPDDAPRSLGIDMLVAGGKTNTITQFTELARRAGLEIRAATTQASGRFIVECHPRKDRA